MSKQTKRVLMVLLLMALVLPAGASAALVKLGERAATAANETVSEDLYLGGGSVTAGGQILGDLLAVGGNLVVTGPIAVDAGLIGGSITVLSSVGDDLRIVGGNVTVNSVVEGDLAVAGGNITIAGGRVRGDFLGGGGVITLNAPVQGDVHLKGGEVYINAPVGGNVIVTARKVTLGSAAAISGSLTYEAAEEANVEQGARVAGETNYIPWTVKEDVRERALAVISVIFLFKALAVLVAALFLGLFFRRFAMTLVSEVVGSPIREFFRGVVVMIVVPILSFILLASVVGIPLGVLGLVGFVALLVLGGIMAPILIGSLLWRQLFKMPFTITWKSILLGVVVCSLLALIPIIGWLINLSAILLTIGAAVKIKWDIARQWR
ncbi:hypothetical protein A3D66_02530 [Candidatus Kaiserbacteria bacterium RIFCSPHIGHO2_02_FULL_50_9]|nr:MAG: hypothetical protein A2761_03210 [Candidatus Kaiserbacteria bacterium RIFCSPHIGHO2_01_FULL_51_33]OGG63812.1 MAG: hypothetical protein A3D66_02530 [Candidatus Kaiserbacteria bacterium RIFCSPHIGHO2_02_FULL_50_9]